MKESISQQQRFDQTEITFSLRKNGGYICSSLGGRSVLVVRQVDEKFIVTKFSKSCKLASNTYFNV